MRKLIEVKSVQDVIDIARKDLKFSDSDFDIHDFWYLYLNENENWDYLHKDYIESDDVILTKDQFLNKTVDNFPIY